MKYALIILTSFLLATPFATALADGEAVYKKTCKKCHHYGVAGAPKPGDKADWAARGKQGFDTLVEHAVKGFRGSKATMPAKGGNTSLTDAEVKSAVQYMVDQSK